MSDFSFLNLNVLPPNHGNGSHRLLLPLAPRSQHVMDLPFLNLNSSLENDMANQAMPPPATPATMEKNQSQRERVQNHLPLETIDLEAETWSFQDLLQGECGQLLQSLADNPVEQGFSNQVESYQVASSQYQEGERSVAVNGYEGHAVQQAEGENQGIDLNKIPLQKPKRKKHRPKVIREGKLTRTPKPATPKPPKTTENRLGKRKYVRKKKDASPQETPTNPRESPSSAGVGEVVDQDRQSRNKSVRRSLNFDLEDSQVVDQLSGSASMMCRQNVLESQGQEAHASLENGSSWTTLVHCSQGKGPVALDGLTDCGAGFDSSQNQFGNESTVRIPQTPMQPPQPSRQVMMATKWQQDFDRMLNNMDMSLQSVRREGENLKELARTIHRQNISGNLARFLEDRQTRIASSRNSEVLLHGEKRGNSLVFHAQVPENMNFMQANNRSAVVNGVCDASSSDQCYSEIHKRRRTENGQKEPMLSASSMSSSTPKGLITVHTLRHMREVRTFADAQRYMALEKQSSKHVLELNQETGTSDGQIQDHGLISTPSKPFVHNKMDCMQPPTPEKVPEYRNGQGTLGCGPQAQPPTPEKVPEYRNGQETLGRGPQPPVEVPFAKQKAKARSRGKKEQEPLINSMAGNAKQTVHVAAASQIGYCPTTESAPQKSRMKTVRQGSSPPQDTHDGNSYEAAACSGFQSGALVLYKDPVDEIVWRLRHLDINSAHEDITIQPQNALVPYAGAGGAMVPFEGPFDLIKKRKPRPKVDLDPESHRVWKLLMGKESSSGEDGTDVDKEKWWEEERRVFRGRADSFIARMHLIQGDRRFSKWKGSVVDSVIGVFLTQNVSDHLSSSAFMCLAARFPPQSKGNTSADKSGTISRLMVGNDTTRKGETSDPESCAQSSLGINESEQRSNKEMVNSNESLESNGEGGTIDYSKESTLEFHEIELGIGQESPDSTLGATGTVTSCTSAVEGDDRKSPEDVVSSQNSVASSQNSSECPSQTTDQSQPSPLLNFEADELLNGGRSNGFCTFTELLEMADGRVLNDLKATGNGRILSTEHSGMIDWSAALQIDRSPSIPNGAAYLDGAGTSIYASNSHLHSAEHDFSTLSYASSSYCHQNLSTSRFVGMAKANVTINETGLSYVPTSTFGLKGTNINETASRLYGSHTGSSTNAMDENAFLISKIPPPVDSFGQLNRNPDQLVSCSGTGVRPPQSERHCCCQSEASSKKNASPTCLNLKDGSTLLFQQSEKDTELQMEMIRKGVKTHTEVQNDGTPNTCPDLHYNDQRNKNIAGGGAEANLRKETDISERLSAETSNNAPKGKRVKTETEKKTFDWDSLRRQVCQNNAKKERSSDTIDSLDYEAVRNADVNEIAHIIRERGMNNMLAERIKDFLNRLVSDHGSMDLEWLRDVPPDKAKDYLLSIRGLGLKSVECVRLLTLHHLAFPVDTNVGRICVRLGWVPLQPLPESLQLHLLEMYPMLETIQKYLWPRLCTLDQRTLYELHYQLITFGKVFCTKSKPNCNACPMRGECKHFASAFASARLALPGPEEKRLVSSEVPLSSERSHNLVSNPMPLPLPEGSTISKEQSILRNCEPIIEEPATPEPECIETSEIDIEDAFYNDPDEIPTIRLNFEEFAQNLQNYMEENNMGLQDGDMSKALVAISPEVASIPTPKLKNVSRLRTEHQVYELPDSHPLLEGLDKREPDDPCPYLLAIWTPGETAQSTEPPTVCCNSQDTGKLCDKNTCFSCNSIREARAQMVRGTLLIPCRTANRGSFPLNGTYFQVNEVFADHDSSCNPIDVPRDWIWNLPRRTVYFGTSIPSIFKGLTTEGIQHCFWRGFVCVRGFDRTSRAPRPLFARLHFPASKVTRNKKTAEATAREAK